MTIQPLHFTGTFYNVPFGVAKDGERIKQNVSCIGLGWEVDDLDRLAKAHDVSVSRSGYDVQHTSDSSSASTHGNTFGVSKSSGSSYVGGKLSTVSISPTYTDKESPKASKAVSEADQAFTQLLEKRGIEVRPVSEMDNLEPVTLSGRDLLPSAVIDRLVRPNPDGPFVVYYEA